MSLKVAVVGRAASAKTSLASTLDKETTMLINFDRKKYKGKLAHFNVEKYNGWQSVKQQILDKAAKFKEKHGQAPKTYVFDTVTTLSNMMLAYGKATYKAKKVFSAYEVLDTEMDSFMEFLVLLESLDKNIILNMHLIDGEDGLILMSQSNLKKAGGYLSIVDYSVMTRQTKEGPEVTVLGETALENDFVRCPVDFKKEIKEPKLLLKDNSTLLQDYIDKASAFESQHFGEEL